MQKFLIIASPCAYRDLRPAVDETRTGVYPHTPSCWRHFRRLRGDGFATLVAECPMSRGFYVYVRKSNATAEATNANYLQAQLDLVERLRTICGPAARVTPLTDDDSAWGRGQ